MTLLTPLELADLTGYTLPAKQKAWLRARGWVFEVDRWGRPKVSRAHAELRLGGVQQTAAPEPNWEALSGA